MGDRGQAVDRQRASQDAQRVQALAGQRDPPHEHQQRPAAGHAGHDADRHLQGELLRDVAGGAQAGAGCGEQRDEQGDPDGVVGPGLALQEHPAAAADLAAAEDGKLPRPGRSGPARCRAGARGASRRKTGNAPPPRPPPRSPGCPATPIHTVATATGRNRRQPMRMPPSNKMTASATVTTCSTAAKPRLPSRGQISDAAAAPIRKNAGAGIRSRSLTRLDSTAAMPVSAATSTARPNDSTPPIRNRRHAQAPSPAFRCRPAVSGRPSANLSADATASSAAPGHVGALLPATSGSARACPLRRPRGLAPAPPPPDRVNLQWLIDSQ